jgi:anti-anti-sigma factor
MEMIVTDACENIVRVQLRGRLDTPGVDAVETRLTALLVPGGQSALVDLSGVEFAGSMAIRMFLAIAKALARRNRRLVLYAPQPPVAELFAMVSLGDLVPIAPDGDAALERARG